MKELNLLGIRKRAILCRIDGITTSLVLISPISEKDEKQLDDDGYVYIDNNRIDKKDIYCYGEINLSSQDDIEYIRKFNLIDTYNGGNIHSNFDYKKGIVMYEGVVKTHPTFDVIDWFKYNYCLIGKPKRIIIYKCKKEDL